MAASTKSAAARKDVQTNGRAAHGDANSWVMARPWCDAGHHFTDSRHQARPADIHANPEPVAALMARSETGSPIEEAVIRGAKAGAKAGQTRHCGLAGHALGVIGPNGHQKRSSPTAAGESPATYSHRRPLAARAEGFVSPQVSPASPRFSFPRAATEHAPCTSRAAIRSPAAARAFSSDGWQRSGRTAATPTRPGSTHDGIARPASRSSARSINHASISLPVSIAATSPIRFMVASCADLAAASCATAARSFTR